MVEDRLRSFLTEQLRTQDVRHSKRNLYAHLEGTHDLLHAWDNPEPVCAAGLFHSIYGTWHFRHKAFPIEERQVIRDLIGKEAEFLAYVFCVTQRPKDFLANIFASDIVMRDHHAGHALRLTRAELNKLLEIEAANLIEQKGNIGPLLQQLRLADISAGAKAGIATCLASPPLGRLAGARSDPAISKQ
jgi:hypothetical protein